MTNENNEAVDQDANISDESTQGETDKSNVIL
jgi:hypothetical protein